MATVMNGEIILSDVERQNLLNTLMKPNAEAIRLRDEWLCCYRAVEIREEGNSTVLSIPDLVIPERCNIVMERNFLENEEKIPQLVQIQVSYNIQIDEKIRLGFEYHENSKEYRYEKKFEKLNCCCVKQIPAA